jgi:twinkle protein
VPHPYGKNGKPAEKVRVSKTKEEVAEQLAEISKVYPTVELPERSLRKNTLDYFGCKVAVSEQDGVTPIMRFQPFTKDGNLIGYKAKMHGEKRMWVMGSIKDADLYGWDQALASGARKLFITEGEEDANALYQALKDKQAGTKWADLDPAVTSLISGGSSAGKDLARLAKKINRNFKEIVLVFDMDEAGKKAVREAMKVFPHAHSVDIPGKDANDCVIEGKSKALANAVLFKSNTVKNTRIVTARDLIHDAAKAPEWGLSWPWEWMTEATRGIREGETYYIGAGVKMGKSEIVNTLGVHLIREHGQHIFLAKPEEAKVKTVKMLAGKVEGHFFHDPKRPFDEKAYYRCVEQVADNAHILDVYQNLDWQVLRADIIDAVRMGCKSIFIDPITNLTNGIGSGDANTKLQEIAQDVSAMSKDMGFSTFIFCHLKAPDSGDPHERGGKVLSHQFAGSRAMMRSCNYMFGLEGNKDPELEMEDKNMRKFVILEDREFGESGYVNLYWDHHTGLFNEVKEK